MKIYTSSALAAASLLLLLVSTHHQVNSALVKKRSIRDIEDSSHSSNNSEPAPRIGRQCRTNAVCGWEVYEPFSRNSQYYIASSCECATEETCIRTDDDLSIPAYVYRCRNIVRKKKKNRGTRRPTAPSSTVISTDDTNSID